VVGRARPFVQVEFINKPYFLSLCLPDGFDVEEDSEEVLRGIFPVFGAEIELIFALDPDTANKLGAEAGSLSFVLTGAIIKLLLLDFFSVDILFELFLRLKINDRDFLDEMRCSGACPLGLTSPVRLTISVLICASSSDTKPSLNHD